MFTAQVSLMCPYWHSSVPYLAFECWFALKAYLVMVFSIEMEHLLNLLVNLARLL